MKVLILIALSLASTHAMALSKDRGGDCMPVAFRLPDKGQGCALEASFGDPLEALLYTCGAKLYLLETEPPATSGEFKGCIVVKKVIEETAK